MSTYSDLAEDLEVVDPTKPLGTKLFNALARVTVSVAVEAVCLRINPANNKVEVYLTQRPETDPAYPGQWHCPGSIMRPGEEIVDIFVRLSRQEFDSKDLSWTFVANANHPFEARGHFFSLIYLCYLGEKDGLSGEWFPVDQLPEKTVTHHRARIIPAAVGAFVAENTSVRL